MRACYTKQCIFLSYTFLYIFAYIFFTSQIREIKFPQNLTNFLIYEIKFQIQQNFRHQGNYIAANLFVLVCF